MSKIKRTVSFYRLSVKKYTEDHYSRKTTVEYLSEGDIEKIFKEILEKSMQKLSNLHYATEVKTNSNKYVIEIISYNNNIAFAKIGLQNDASTFALRDQSTLESENVPMSESQLLEVYTYFLIDFSTGIIAYVGINGAPRISAIQSLFNKYYCAENNSECVVVSIMTRDVLKIIKRKSKISKILLTVAVPSNNILNEVTGETRNDFYALQNVKTSTIQYTVVALRNSNIFSNSSNLSEFMANVKSKFGDNLKNVSVNAKDDDGPTQTYDLLEYNFTQKVSLVDSNSEKLSEDDFREALMKTYNSNKKELLEFIR